MEQYALFSYSTENIGDEIQSIAARRFLPRVDAYIDRDRIGEWSSPFSSGPVKLIANGWYMRDPFSWPPRDKSIDPLLISMYVEQNGVGPDLIKPSDVFLTPESLEYLRAHGPVGARDLSTLEFFQTNGIDSYFSGCLTLTLEADNSVPRQDYVLAIDVPDAVYETMSSSTSRPIIRMSPFGDFSLDLRERICLAELFLCAYRSAHAVVTTRLHALLPCLAFETPVLLIKEPGRYDSQRYAGLAELAYSADWHDYASLNVEYDIDYPPNNPTNYLSLREQLVKKCHDFTGYDCGCSLSTHQMAELITDEQLLNVIFDSYHKRHVAMLTAREVRDLQTRVKRLDADLQDAKQQLNQANRERDFLRHNYDLVKTTSLYWILRGIRRRLFK